MKTGPSSTLQASLDALDAQGFVLLKAALPQELVDAMLTQLQVGLSDPAAGVKSRQGDTYAARNVLEAVPQASELWQQPQLLNFLEAVLGQGFGLVRALYFDKHPDRTWSLGWHKDMTIAVKDNSLPSERFSKPTRKAGVPHVEGSLETLEQMVTLRIHLDPVSDENGPLQCIPGSHLSGKQSTDLDADPVVIKCDAGDVLAMRPLVSHASGSSHAGTRLHRRILHLEFAAANPLGDGYQWYQFIRPSVSSPKYDAGQPQPGDHPGHDRRS